MSKIRKYCTNWTEPALSQIIRQQKADEATEIHLRGDEDDLWYLSLYQAEPEWDEYTKAVGAILFVPHEMKKATCVSFDLFYDIDDILAFWEAHKDGFDCIELLADQFPIIANARKDKRLDGTDRVDEEHPSEWAEIYAASLFYDRGWATLDEYHDACFSAHLLQILFQACDEGEAVCIPPGEDDIEINLRFGRRNGSEEN